MGNELVNAPNTNATHRGEVNEQHQNVAKSIVERDLVVVPTTHQKTPQTITQSEVVNVHNDDNHEHVQPLDEVISVQQPWRSTTLGYNLPRISASTPITTFAGFQNQASHTNIHLVSTNLEMERFHLLNRLEQLHHLD
jgi:hypothetical protein